MWDHSVANLSYCTAVAQGKEVGTFYLPGPIILCYPDYFYHTLLDRKIKRSKSNESNVVIGSFSSNRFFLSTNATDRVGKSKYLSLFGLLLTFADLQKLKKNCFILVLQCVKMYYWENVI